MAEILRQAYSSVVPFSCIPTRFTEPLILESTGEYTLDKSQFPGLLDEEHARQPALIIAPVDSSPQIRSSRTELNCDHYSTPTSGMHAPTNPPPCPVSQHENSHFTEQPTLPLAAVTGHSNSLHRHLSIFSRPHGGKHIRSDLTKAREDLLTLLSGLQEKEFAMTSNPFDSMPALLSAVSYDCLSASAHQTDACQSRARAARQTHLRRKRLCHVMKVRESMTPAYQPSSRGFKYQGDLENIPQMLQNVHSRKRSYQVDDLDDILLREYRVNKKRKTMAPQCHQELFTASEPFMSLSTGHGIMGY